MSPAPCNEQVDILDYLPHSAVVRYQAGELIYDRHKPARCLYLITEGRVQVCRDVLPDLQVVLDIYTSEEIFGESALLNPPGCPETATALDNTQVMMWTEDKLQNIMRSRPQVGIALGQILVRRLIASGNRLESLATDNINQRLVRTLIHLAERLGRPASDGSVEINGLQHKLLAEYAVASRATVTYWMNYFRRHGLLEYSRNFVLLYPDALKQWLTAHPSHPERSAAPDAERWPPATAIATKSLSQRECQVMELVAEGLKNKQIAQRLCIREQTVKNHLQNIFGRLQVNSRHQAVSCLAHISKAIVH